MELNTVGFISIMLGAVIAYDGVFCVVNRKHPDLQLGIGLILIAIGIISSIITSCI